MTTLADFELGTMPGVWQAYHQGDLRQMKFEAQSADEAQAWQDELRPIVYQLLGGDGVRCDLNIQVIEQVQAEGFRYELIVLQTQPGEYMPCYVLIPNAPPPYKPMIALHGHGSYGARTIIGLSNNPGEAEHIEGYGGPYARQLVEAGYLVFAPVLRGFAERMEARELEAIQRGDDNHWRSSCQSLGLNLMLCGKTLMGLRVWDVRRLIDYIQTRDDLQGTSLGCVGLSGGGTLTLYVAGVDTRITCAYLSGCLNTFQESIMSIDHCVCNYIPGILQYAEMADLAGLIAPRPLLIENGSVDPIYPVHGMHTALETIQQVYARFNASERVEAHVFEGAHRWYGMPMNAWLERWM